MPLLLSVHVKSHFLEKRGMQSFAHLFILFCLYSRNKSSILIVFLTSAEIPSQPSAFLFLIFLITSLSRGVSKGILEIFFPHRRIVEGVDAKNFEATQLLVEFSKSLTGVRWSK